MFLGGFIPGVSYYNYNQLQTMSFDIIYKVKYPTTAMQICLK